MTAAKVVDILSRLLWCAGQAADAVSAYTQDKMEDAHDVIEKFQSQNVQIFGYVYQNTNGQNHCPVWKTQLFLLTASVRWSLGRTSMGTAIWEVCVCDFKVAGKMREL